MTDEAALSSGTTDASNAASVSLDQSGADTSAVTTGTFSAPSEQSTDHATVGDVQGATETDPLEGVPSLEELSKLPDGTQYKESLIQLRTAIEENFKPKLSELEGKLKPLELFQPYADRFQKPEELQQIVDFREKLYGWETDPTTNQLIPATQSLVEELTQTAPDRADFLAADLLNGLTTDKETGRQLPRIDLALEAIAADPERRAKALSILGGVEPTSVSPTWQPTQEELELIKDNELQDIYKKLPYEEREELKLNSPEYINRVLSEKKLINELQAEREATKQRETAEAQRREAYINEQADNAGNEIVERQFKERFANYAKNVCEKWQPIKPLDPNSPPQGMSQEQVAAANQEISQINTGAAMLAVVATVAFSHPDTRWVAEEFGRAAGILNDERLKVFDQSRLDWANSARQFGNLKYRATLGKNGNGQLPQDVSMLETNANRAMDRLVGQARPTTEAIMGLLDKFFTMRAQSHNSTLNGAATARVPVSGSSFDPTAAPSRPPSAPLTRAEIDRLFG